MIPAFFLSWINPTVNLAYSDLMIVKTSNRLYPSVRKHVDVTRKVNDARMFGD